MTLNDPTCRICSSVDINSDKESLSGEAPELSKLTEQPGFKIFHQNVRGLYGTKDEISNILSKNSINIFGVTETFLTVNQLTTSVEIPGYSFEYKIRESGVGGGAGAYVKNGTPYVRRYDLEEKILNVFG